MNKLVIALVVYLSVFSLSAQEKVADFKPSGKPVVKVFANMHQGFGSDDFQDASGFEITRAVLGYQYQFSPLISSKVIVDMDNPGAGKLTEVAYLRNAYIAYNDDRLSAYFGVIGMKQFKTQENNWGYRYIYKSAMDHYKFNNSVDAGFYVKYKFADWVSADLTVSNGEGAKKQQDLEGKYRTGYGVEFKFLKGFTLRSYSDMFYAPESTPDGKNQNTLALFLGYKADKFRFGTEYNTLFNFGFDDADDRNIYSAYGTYSFTDKINAFARYDRLEADVAGLSEEVYLIGCEYKVVKGVTISPNYRYGDFAFKSPKGEGHFLYLNFEYKF